MSRTLLCAVIVLLASGGAARAQGKDAKLWWPQFLGPQRDGISREKIGNTDWKKTPPKVLWKVPLGEAMSSFTVVGDRLYTTAKHDKMDAAVCLDAANGKEIWSVDLAPTYVDRQRQGSGPRSTPTYHDGKLYLLMPMGELFCLAAEDGKKLWSADQFKDTGASNPAGGFYYWGASLSPLIEGDLVIVQPGGSKQNSVAAYHKDSGKLVWKAGDDPAGYGSPIAVTIEGQRQLIVPTGSSVLGIEPTKGTVLWRYVFGNQYNATCTTPVWSDNLLFVSAAYGVGSACLEITVKNGTWTATEKWKHKKLQVLFATAMVVDGHVYGCHGDLSAFALKCLDLKTGEVKWEERMDDRQSLLAIDGYLLCWGERGSLRLLELQPKAFVQKGELRDLLKYKAWAAPALADGRLYLRDQSTALCLDLRKP
jgi:outer membrane protein assembly factor BamB